MQQLLPKMSSMTLSCCQNATLYWKTPVLSSEPLLRTDYQAWNPQTFVAKVHSGFLLSAAPTAPGILSATSLSSNCLSQLTCTLLLKPLNISFPYTCAASTTRAMWGCILSLEHIQSLFSEQLAVLRILGGQVVFV